MQEEKDLFKVQLDEKGIHSIHRIYRIVSLCFWTGVIVNAVMLYSPLNIVFKYSNILKASSSSYKARLLIIIVYMILFTIVYFFQFFYFLKFAGKAKRSIRFNDSNTFNESLSWLYRAFWMTITGVVLNGIYALYVVFGKDGF